MNHTADRVRHWLSDVALPLWAGIGVDQHGGFVERLTAAGEPDLTADKRVRVQARQIYVFSHAHLTGLMPAGNDVATQGYEFLVRHAFPDGVAAGAVHALDRHGAVRDTRRDTYDHAFLIFAFSWYYRATHRADVRDMLMALDDVVQQRLRHPLDHGYRVDDGDTRALHQNPHMHLFEAMLSAHEATGEERFLERADELFGLFRHRMFDPAAGVLREFYDERWYPAAGAAGAVVEPGHHCEWVWLLQWYARRSGTQLCEEAYRLADFVACYGRPGGGVLLCDEVRPDGRVVRASTRSWPQTEAIKADIALAEARGTTPGTHVDAVVEALFERFLDRPVAGAWTDWIDERGMPLVETVPASTFYHLFLAFAEYLRVRTA